MWLNKLINFVLVVIKKFSSTTSCQTMELLPTCYHTYKGALENFLITTKANVAVLEMEHYIFCCIFRSHYCWVLTVVASTVVMRSLAISVLEVKCISNLSPNHTLQLTTLRTAVSESLQKIWCWFSHRGYYICKTMVIIACSLMYMQV